jgi:hypothetical protein
MAHATATPAPMIDPKTANPIIGANRNFISLGSYPALTVATPLAFTQVPVEGHWTSDQSEPGEVEGVLAALPFALENDQLALLSCAPELRKPSQTAFDNRAGHPLLSWFGSSAETANFMFESWRFQSS